MINNEEYLKSQYKTLRTTFDKAANYLEYTNAPFNKENLDCIILELEDKCDSVLHTSIDNRLLFFTLDFYQDFLEIIFPKIIEILIENNNDVILSAGLIPRAKSLNEEFIKILKSKLKKYNLIINDLIHNDPYTDDLLNFKSLFIKKGKGYPDFDYKLNSWQSKKSNIENKLASVRKSLLATFGSDYEEMISLFDTFEILRVLKTLTPVYDTLLESETGNQLITICDVEIKSNQFKQKK